MKKAIAEHEKTIILTVGQLTVGVTIPEWSAVLMLCSMSSPAACMQAAFRAQNPCSRLVRGEEIADGKLQGSEELVIKENACVFDFDPTRSLVIFDDFAVNLSPETAGGAGTGEERERKVRELLNFLPVIGEDAQGKMIELDAAQVLSLPRRLKSREVLRHGFMSNFLFQNIGAIFSAPAALREILEKLPLASEEKRRPRPEELRKIRDIQLDVQGNIEITDELAIGQARELFGDKIHALAGELEKEADKAFAGAARDDVLEIIAESGAWLKEELDRELVGPVSEARELSKAHTDRLEKESHSELDRKLAKIAADYEREKKIADFQYGERKKEAADVAEEEAARAGHEAALQSCAARAREQLAELARESFAQKPAQMIKAAEGMKAARAGRLDEELERIFKE